MKRNRLNLKRMLEASKKKPLRSGLLSDFVLPEELTKINSTTLSEPAEETPPVEGQTENPEATPTEAPSEAAPVDDNASWKTNDNPGESNTNDGNQGCKKSSNQSEYGDEIGLEEAEQIVTDLDNKVENGEIVDPVAVDTVDSLQDALESTSEVIEEKTIMDEAVENNELTNQSVEIFKDKCEDYLEDMNGQQTSETGEPVSYIEDEPQAGLENDQASLKNRYLNIWAKTEETVSKVFGNIKKVHDVLGK